MCVRVYVFLHRFCVCGSQMRLLDLWKVELQETMSRRKGAGTTVESSERASV